MAKNGAAGWDAAQARMATRQQGRVVRLRVHEDCVQSGDERLGLSALVGAKCGRCRKPVRGTAIVVQLFRGYLVPVNVLQDEVHDTTENRS